MTSENPAMHSGIRVLTEAQRRALIASRFQTPTEATPHPAVVIEILNVEAVREMDPLVLNRDVCPCWGISEPTIIEKDGVKIMCVTPVEPGTKTTLDLPLELYEAIVGSAGVEPTEPAASDWGVQGQAAARELLRDVPSTHGLAGFRQQAEVRLRMAEAEAAWYGSTPSQIAEVTGRPYVPRRSLRPTGGKAVSLTLARKRTEAESARSAEALRIETIERTRPNDRPIGEVAGGLEAICVPLNDIGVQIPIALQAFRPMWQDADGRVFFVWRRIPGLMAPECEFAGARVLPPTHVIPTVPAKRLEEAAEPTTDVVALISALRRKQLPLLERGKVENFSKAGLEGAKALAASWSHILYTPMFGQGWRPSWMLQAIVRGYQIAPPLAVAVVWEALLATHSRCTGEPRRIPRTLRRKVGSINFMSNLIPGGGKGTGDMIVDDQYSPTSYPAHGGAVQRDDVERLAVEAAASGEVEPGSLLPARDATSKKKHR